MSSIRGTCHCKNVLALDISYGAIACAKILNNADNIYYYRNNRNDLNKIESCSVDLIYAFAVVQHINDKQFEETLKQFYVILKPLGKVICHITLNETGLSKPEEDEIFFFKYLRDKFALRMTYRSRENVVEKVIKAGFKEPNVIPIRELSNVKDDIVNQHILVFDK